MKSLKLTLPVLFITLVQAFWAAPSRGAALRRDPGSMVNKREPITPRIGRGVTRSRAPNQLPAQVSFRVVRNRGLLVDTWINGSGPYTFAIDTGAGDTIISERLAATVGISIDSGRVISMAGLSGREQRGGREGMVKTLALGYAANLLPANHSVLVSGGLPADIDGILDPTEAYSPFGYVIDIPNHEIGAFDCVLHPLSTRNPPPDGAVVHWLMRGASRRPFVSLDDGRLALLDTGSAFGLAVNQNSSADRHNGKRVEDIGGGSVTSRRAEPSTVSIGSLTLRKVPTDVLSGVEKGAPTLLGRDALYPFRLTFDPLHKLIAIGPAER